MSEPECSPPGATGSVVQEPRASYDNAKRHLLLSFPDLDASASGPDAVDHLIEGAIHHLLSTRAPGAILTVGEVVDAIRSMAGLHYEAAEVTASLSRLETASRVTFTNVEKRAFVFSERRYRELCQDAAYRAQRLSVVRQEWGDDLSRRHPELTSDQADALWAALDLFTAQLVGTFAAEAAAFLYQAEGAHERFREVLDQRLPQIASIAPPDLRGVAEDELRRFFENTSAARTDYLANRMRASFVFHLLSLDPEASELVRENVSEKTLYLDTNFVIRLLGFDGPTLAYSPLAVLQMSKALNCRLVVAEETVHEFLRRLRQEVKEVRRNPISQEQFQRLVAAHPGDEFAFMQAYYRELLAGKVKTPGQFERKYSTVDVLLREYGIEVDADAEVDDEDLKSPEFLDLQSAFNQWTKSQRHPDNVAHDAFMVMLMRELRGRRDKRASTVRVWFLTYDRSLTSFSSRCAGPDQLPVVMLADDWIQIARPFLPRTAEYDASFVSLLRFPVAFEDPSVIKLSEMLEAVEKLDRFKDVPGPVMGAMVSDAAMLTRIRQARDEKTVAAIIEVEAAKYARTQEEQVARLAQQNAELSDRVGQLETITGEQREKNNQATDVAMTVTRERDAAVAAFETLNRDLPARLEAARRDGQRESDDRWSQKIASVEDRMRGEMERRTRVFLCAVGWITQIAIAVGMFMRVPAARTGLGLVLLILTFALGTYALAVYARHGRDGNALSKSADWTGVISLLLLLAQALGLLQSADQHPDGRAAIRNRDTSGASPAATPTSATNRGSAASGTSANAPGDSGRGGPSTTSPSPKKG